MGEETGCRFRSKERFEQTVRLNKRWEETLLYTGQAFRMPLAESILRKMRDVKNNFVQGSRTDGSFFPNFYLGESRQHVTVYCIRPWGDWSPVRTLAPGPTLHCLQLPSVDGGIGPDMTQRTDMVSTCSMWHNSRYQMGFNSWGFTEVKRLPTVAPKRRAPAIRSSP